MQILRHIELFRLLRHFRFWTTTLKITKISKKYFKQNTLQGSSGMPPIYRRTFSQRSDRFRDPKDRYRITENKSNTIVKSTRSESEGIPRSRGRFPSRFYRVRHDGFIYEPSMLIQNLKNPLSRVFGALKRVSKRVSVSAEKVITTARTQPRGRTRPFDLTTAR